MLQNGRVILVIECFITDVSRSRSHYSMSDLRFLFLLFLTKSSYVVPSSSAALFSHNRIRRHIIPTDNGISDVYEGYIANSGRSRRSLPSDTPNFLLLLQESYSQVRRKRDLKPFTPFAPMKSLGSLPSLESPDWSSLSNLNLKPSYSAATSLSQAQHVNRKNPSLDLANSLAFTLDINGPLGSSSSEYHGSQNTGNNARSSANSVAGKKNGTASANADTVAEITGPGIGTGDNESASTINKANIFVGGGNAVANSNARGTVGGSPDTVSPPNNQPQRNVPVMNNVGPSLHQNQQQQQGNQAQNNNQNSNGNSNGNRNVQNVLAPQAAPVTTITTTTTTTTTTTQEPATQPMTGRPVQKDDSSSSDSFFASLDDAPQPSSNSQKASPPSDVRDRRRTPNERGPGRHRNHMRDFFSDANDPFSQNNFGNFGNFAGRGFFR